MWDSWTEGVQNNSGGDNQRRKTSKVRQDQSGRQRRGPHPGRPQWGHILSPKGGGTSPVSTKWVHQHLEEESVTLAYTSKTELTYNLGYLRIRQDQLPWKEKVGLPALEVKKKSAWCINSNPTYKGNIRLGREGERKKGRRREFSAKMELEGEAKKRDSTGVTSGLPEIKRKMTRV